MKINFLYIVSIFFLFSCQSDIKNDENIKINENDEVNANENPIVRKWKLQMHKKDDVSNKEIDLKSQPTELILSIMESGYFVIYDTFIDPKFSQKGFNRISERSKGQWEIINDNELVLHHVLDDSNYVEKLHISKLDKNTLITKGEDKKSNIYKTYVGY